MTNLVTGSSPLSDHSISSFFALLSLPWSGSPLFERGSLEKNNTQRQVCGYAGRNPTNFIQIAKTFIIACLEVLAWLGPTAHIAERKRYFSSISSSNSGLFSDEEVRTHAIGNLPLLLARIGFDHVNEFTDQLG